MRDCHSIVFLKFIDNLQSITLFAKLGSGGEGTVYAAEGNPDICVKIYHEQKRTPELEAKLKAMIDAPPKDPTLAAGHYSICWPTNVVYEDEACTKFLGFTMPRIDRNIFKEYHLLCDKPGVTTSTCYRLEHFGTGFTYLHMYVVALNLASCVASIHNAGHAIGDLNDKNILVSTKDSKITIVDCDSFEIHAQDEKIFPCSVYMPEYSAPEVIQRKDIKNRQESDRFALSILIFKLLMLNTHPYASRGSSVEHLNTPGEKIASGYYPYEEYADLDVNPPAYALPYEIIPPNIKALFRRCFVEGQHEPEKRPTAIEWFVAIKENYEAMTAKVQNKLVMCGNNARHFFPTHLTTCPWCAMEEDYFPVVVPQKKQRQAATQTVIDQFAYLREMIDDFAKDNRINGMERVELFKIAKAKKIPKSEVIKLINKKSQSMSTLILGDNPTISNNEILFNDKKEASFTITNNFFNDPLTIKIQKCPVSFTIQPQKCILLPSKAVTIKINISRVMKVNIDEEKFEISLKSKNYTSVESFYLKVAPELYKKITSSRNKEVYKQKTKSEQETEKFFTTIALLIYLVLCIVSFSSVGIEFMVAIMIVIVLVVSIIFINTLVNGLLKIFRKK